jgi:hypothetical protein
MVPALGYLSAALVLTWAVPMSALLWVVLASVLLLAALVQTLLLALRPPE